MLVGFLGMLLGVGLLAPLLQVEFEQGVLEELQIFLLLSPSPALGT